MRYILLVFTLLETGLCVNMHRKSCTKITRRELSSVPVTLASVRLLRPRPSSASTFEADSWAVSTLYDAIDTKSVNKVLFSSSGRSLVAVDEHDLAHHVDIFQNDVESIESRLEKQHIPFEVEAIGQSNGFLNSLGVFLNIAFPVALIGTLISVSRRASLGAMPPSFQSDSKIQLEPSTNVTFDDVAGCNESKLELTEVVEFLKTPEKFSEIGAKTPRGVLLEGPPGTGKTLLARALAGEAGVPFISTSGSEFVELFVGVGASRVRNLFDEAKKNTPCILFIDEIDAIGRARSTRATGQSNDEREQTLNQILTEMDGFQGSTGVLVVAATNRGDVLDDALLRPGRFDRRIPVNLPTRSGRFDILNVHCKNKKLNPLVDLNLIARRTTGFSGASLENLMNEAAIVAVRRGRKCITNEDIDYALDRITVGIQRNETSVLPYTRSKEIVAYHEAGHALVAALSPDYDSIEKVTIIPRSNGAGGFTLFTLSDERQETGLYSQRYLKARLAVALGGRVAEELVFGQEEITTGASSDLQTTKSLARRMVTQWGFRNNTSQTTVHDVPIAWESPMELNPTISEYTNTLIEHEIKSLIEYAYDTCVRMLTSHRDTLDAIAKELLEHETIDGIVVDQILGTSHR